jgi:hypothetical protein
MVVSDLVKESLRLSIGKKIIFFLEKGNFRFEGIVLGCDDEYLKIHDTKKDFDKFIRISEIKEAELYG